MESAETLTIVYYIAFVLVSVHECKSANLFQIAHIKFWVLKLNDSYKLWMHCQLLEAKDNQILFKY